MNQVLPGRGEEVNNHYPSVSVSDDLSPLCHKGSVSDEIHHLFVTIYRAPLQISRQLVVPPIIMIP